jgi:hypothetical protein
MSATQNIDWDIVKKDCRQMGLFFMAATAIFSILPIEASAGRLSIGFVVGFVIWFLGLSSNREPSA